MTQTLTVPLRPSRVLALALTIVAGTALACAWISLPHLAFPPIAAGIALAWAWHLAQALQWSRSALHVLEFDAKGGVRCRDAQGLWHEAEILPGAYVSVWLILLILGTSSGRRSLVLLPDAATGDELRRLRVWLRWRPARR